MRFSIFLFVVLLAGCATDPMDGRAPSTPSELQQVKIHGPRIARVGQAILDANADLCAETCRFSWYLKVANGINATAAGDGQKAHIFLSLDMAESLVDDDEIGYVLGHEWSHYLLKHDMNMPRQYTEVQADCVGTIIAARAGYSATAGRGPVRRLKSTTMALLGAHPDAGPRLDEIARVASAIRGKPLNKDTIRRVCGVTIKT